MAKLPALVSAIAKVDGRDPKSIGHVARVIREAGYIPTGKRGAGAADMNAQSAANLLIALNCTPLSPTVSLPALDFVRSLKPLPRTASEELPSDLEAVARTGDFGEALAVLIDAMPNLVRWLQSFVFEGDHASMIRPEAKAGFHRLMMMGGGPAKLDVEIGARSAGMSLMYYDSPVPLPLWRVDFVSSVDHLEVGYRLFPDHDRRVTVTFGLVTLDTVSSCITGVPEADR